ncbi:hypothetical protein BHE74_00040789 [Ensete ventricosum]|nr:hypothetical protein BHE74_00040789 [Ensete ventricosum]
MSPATRPQGAMERVTRVVTPWQGGCKGGRPLARRLPIARGYRRQRRGGGTVMAKRAKVSFKKKMIMPLRI